MAGWGWLFWGLTISAGMLSARVSTVMTRGAYGVEQQGATAALQSLSFFAVLMLIVVPFFAADWYFALPLALAASFLNPAMFLVSRSNMATLYQMLPLFNIAALAGAVYFGWRVIMFLNRGYGQL